MNEKNNIREYPITVISLKTYGEHNVHDIQQNSAWTQNPYSDYAIVPDKMVEGILKTKGYCDIALNTEETEIISFAAREILAQVEHENIPTTTELIQAELLLNQQDIIIKQNEHDEVLAAILLGQQTV